MALGNSGFAGLVAVLLLFSSVQVRAEDIKAGIDPAIAEKIEKLKLKIEENPSDIRPYYELGVCYMENGDTADAIKQFESMAKIKPDVPAPYYYMGKIYDMENNFERAYEYYEKFTAKSREKSKTESVKERLSELGASLFAKYRDLADTETGDTRIEAIKKLLRYEVKNQYFYELLAAYENSGRFEEMQQLLEKRLKEPEDQDEIRKDLKARLEKARDINAGISKMMEENSAKSHAKLGKIFSEYDKARAEKHFMTARTLDPDFVALYPELGLFYLKYGDLENAESAFAKYVESETAEKKKELGRKYFDAIQKEKKAQTVEELSEAGAFYVKLNNAERAVAVYRKALEQSAENKNILIDLALACEKAGKYEDAFTVWKRCLKFYPDDRDVAKRVSSLELVYGGVYNLDTKENVNKFLRNWSFVTPEIRIGVGRVVGAGYLCYKKPMKEGGVAFDYKGEKQISVALNSANDKNINSGYAFNFGAWGNTRSEIRRHGIEVVSTKEVIIERGRKYSIKAVSENGEGKFYINDKLILSCAVEGSIKGDKLLIYSSDENAMIDNIKIIEHSEGD